MQLLPKKISLKTSESFIDYPFALNFMTQHVSAMLAGTAQDLVWFLEHPPLYTGGTSAKITDLRVNSKPNSEFHNFPIYSTNRGGQYTYHGPGQRVVYLMLDLRAHQDLRLFVSSLEKWVISTLTDFHIHGELLEGKVGIWIKRNPNLVGNRWQNATQHLGYDKIAALGIRLKKWISFHGLAININPNLKHFSGIVPCGISEQQYGVTSLSQQGKKVSMRQFDEALIQHFPQIFHTHLTPFS